jgi:probable DNA metabolism protein
MSDVVFLYDGSFHGFLCCVFESYEKKEVPVAIYSSEDFEPVLFATRTIATDDSHAIRVLRGILKRSPYALKLVQRGFLTCMENREIHLYQLIRKLLQDGPGFLNNLADPTLYPVLKAVRFLGSEAEKYRGFVRFSDFSGVLGAEIEPKNHVLPILRGHFCSRYQSEKFFIYDRTHEEILLYADGKAIIAPLEHFEMAQPQEEEQTYRILWKRFYDTIAIQERVSSKRRMRQMPKRYWHMLTELQPQMPLKGSNSLSAPPAPDAPGEKSGPAKLSEFLPSVPVSIP